jgi:mRNA interferase RelE/StbE
VKKIDLPKIDQKWKASIKKAIETRLATDAHIFGRPLQRTLKGYWKLRVGTYRIVYKFDQEDIIVLGIIHRDKVYSKIHTRLD